MERILINPNFKYGKQLSQILFQGCNFVIENVIRWTRRIYLPSILSIIMYSSTGDNSFAFILFFFAKG
jgi:hypothetical protein